MDVRAALATCRRRATLKRTLTIAGVVGVVLSLINEGGSILNGGLTASNGWKIGLNFVVPFVVSNLGVLARG